MGEPARQAGRHTERESATHYHTLAHTSESRARVSGPLPLISMGPYLRLDDGLLEGRVGRRLLTGHEAAAHLQHEPCSLLESWRCRLPPRAFSLGGFMRGLPARPPPPAPCTPASHGRPLEHAVKKMVTLSRCGLMAPRPPHTTNPPTPHHLTTHHPSTQWQIHPPMPPAAMTGMETARATAGMRHRVVVSSLSSTTSSPTSHMIQTQYTAQALAWLSSPGVMPARFEAYMKHAIG